jgi:hypothetical protein
MGINVFSPLAQGMFTGHVRKGQQSSLTRSGASFAHLEDELDNSRRPACCVNPTRPNALVARVKVNAPAVTFYKSACHFVAPR